MTATLLIRGGTVVDGTGAPGRVADVVVAGDRIVVVGTGPAESGAEVLDATGFTVTPGFINVLSHAWGSLQQHPSAASDVVQGVTTEVFGEAFSLGPGDGQLSAALQPWGELAAGTVQVDFARLGDGLDHLVGRGVAPNVASFIGGVNLRLLGAGFDDRPLTAAELDRLCGVVDEEMADGALGIGTALIYAPGRYARTDELTDLCRVVARHGGTYISHLRSEGDAFLECLDELVGIARDAGCRAEVYHLKAAGQANWPKMARAIERIDRARADGLQVSADMYPYTAGGTALAAAIPPSFHAGGPAALAARLADPAQRAAMAAQMRAPSTAFENLYLGAGGAGVLFLDDLADGTPARGRRLSDIAADRGRDEVETLLDIAAAEPGRGVAYVLMAEDNVRLGLRQPWVSIGSDAAAHPATAPFRDHPTHPRAYGTFARVLGRYCRDEGLFPLAEAVRRMTSLPATTLGLAGRGRLAPGYAADVAVFDPAAVADVADYDDAHRYATGMRHVVVNGVPVLRDAALTGATPGRRLRRAR